MKFPVHTLLRQRMGKNLIVTSKDRTTYPDNTCQDFRVKTTSPLNTSEDGYSFVKLYSITVPFKLCLRKILRDVTISIDPISYTQWGTKKLNVFPAEGNPVSFNKIELVDRLNTVVQDEDLTFSYHAPSEKCTIFNDSSSDVFVSFNDKRILPILGFDEETIQVDGKGLLVGTGKVKMHSLLPPYLYVYADFVETTHIDIHSKRLLGIVTLNKLYRKHSLEEKTVTLLEPNPFVTHINRDELSEMRFTLTLPNSEPFPFYDLNDTTSITLSFSSKI